MKRVARVLATLAITMVPLGAAQPASACSCLEVAIEDVGPDEYNVAAFVGTAVSVEDVGHGDLDEPEEQLEEPPYRAPMRWTFEVETVLWGDVTDPVVVGTGYGDGDCGTDFNTKGRVGIVASTDDLGYSTSICGGIWDADDLIAAHGPGTDPVAAPTPAGGRDAEDGSSIVIWSIGGAVTVAVGAGIIYWARLRNRPGETKP